MFKKILLILLLVLSFNMIGCADVLGDLGLIDKGPGEFGVLIWPDTELSNMLPKLNAESNIGRIEELTDEAFIVYVGGVSQVSFDEYVLECIGAGYNKNLSYKDNIFDAKNADGYSLYMKYKDNVIYIKLDSPVKNDNTGDNGTNPTEATYKLGMGIVVNIGNSFLYADAQVDSTVAAVVLDENGKIVSCRIDALQNTTKVNDGVLTSGNTTSKAELKEAYNMAPWGQSLVGRGEVLEWYLQAQAFENYVVGKTVEEIKNMSLQEINGYTISADETLLSAGCTIHITEIRDAVVKACNDGQGVTFTTAKEFNLGVAINGYLDVQSYPTTEDSYGVAYLYSDYACTVVIDGKIVAALNDSIQPKVTLGTGEFNYNATKRELKENYCMSIYGGSMDWNADGIVLEWYQQSAAFSQYVVGMTANEVRYMETQAIENGYIISADEALLSAGCTIQINEMKAVVADAVDNSR